MSPENIDYGQAAREEAMDNGGFSRDRIDIAMGRKSVVSSQEPPAPRAVSRPHYSHRGGRSHPEMSGVDASRMIANAEPSRILNPAEQHAADQALAAFKLGPREQLKLQEIERLVERDVPIDPTNPTKSYEQRERYRTQLKVNRGIK